jgi:hypothetical protein
MNHTCNTPDLQTGISALCDAHVKAIDTFSLVS